LAKHLRAPEPRSGTKLRAPDGRPDGSTNQRHPVFCFRYLRNHDECPADDIVALVKKLRQLSQLTWQAISLASSQGPGTEYIKTYQIKVELHEIAKREDSVMAIRYSGKARMLGLREGATLQILWIDHDFTAYQH
jgi:hypothetical protein